MIAIATLKKGESADSYTDSMLRTVRDHLVLNLPASVNTISEQRNRAAAYVLEHDIDWLLFADSDMGWPTDAIDRLLEAADPGTRPVVGALCFGLVQGVEDGAGGFETKPYPTIFDRDGDGFCVRWDYPREQVTRVAATGAAFLLIHRDALAKVRAECGDTWFDRLDDRGVLLGEDLSFCERLDRVGVPVHVHTGVRTTHYKSLWIGEDFYVAYRLAQAVVKGRGSR